VARSAGRIPPQQRLAVFASVAAETKRGKVLVACRSRTVEKQYRHAVRRLGGRPKNLHFVIVTEPPGKQGEAA